MLHNAYNKISNTTTNLNMIVPSLTFQNALLGFLAPFGWYQGNRVSFALWINGYSV